MTELMDTLHKHPEVIISENVTDETENYETVPYHVRGCVLTSVERLDDEFIKLLKECDPHSNEYVERLVNFKVLLGKFVFWMRTTSELTEKK